VLKIVEIVEILWAVGSPPPLTPMGKLTALSGAPDWWLVALLLKNPCWPFGLLAPNEESLAHIIIVIIISSMPLGRA